jgi:uncharacterized membrane protein
VPRSPEEVFDWVADYRHVPEVMDGVSSWRPLGKQSEGVGARYRVELGGLSILLRATLVIVEWERPTAIGWSSESSPVGNSGRWTFRPAAHGATRVELAISYRPPAGAVGNFLAGRVESVLHDRIVKALDRMRERLS